MREATWTPTPPTSSPISSTSPVCAPARTSIPSEGASLTTVREVDGAARPVEGDEEAVTGGLDLAAAVAVEPLTDKRLLLLEQIAPAPITDLGRALGRGDDVGEDDGRQDSVEAGDRAHAGDELLDGRQRSLRVADPGEMVDALELDVAATGDLLSRRRAVNLGRFLVPRAPRGGTGRNGDRHGPAVECRATPPGIEPVGGGRSNGDMSSVGLPVSG